MPADGGTAVQVTRSGGYYAVESEDGRALYYSKVDGPTGIWRMPLPVGDESEVAKGPADWESWSLGRRGLYYATRRSQGAYRRQEFEVQYLDFSSGRTKRVYRKEGAFGHHTLPVSPDEKWLLFGEAPLGQSEVMLIENFR